MSIPRRPCNDLPLLVHATCSWLHTLALVLTYHHGPWIDRFSQTHLSVTKKQTVMSTDGGQNGLSTLDAVFALLHVIAVQRNEYKYMFLLTIKLTTVVFLAASVSQYDFCVDSSSQQAYYLYMHISDVRQRNMANAYLVETESCVARDDRSHCHTMCLCAALPNIPSAVIIPIIFMFTTARISSLCRFTNLSDFRERFIRLHF